MSPTATESPARPFTRSRALPKNSNAADSAETAGASRGWGGYQKAAATLSDSNLYLKVEEEKKIIMVLDAAPFDFFTSHWIDAIKEGSKSVPCWDSLLDDDDQPTMPRCPLCLAGDKPTRISAFFNVITLENPAQPAFKVWEATKQSADQLAEHSDDPKTSPLNKPGQYFVVNKASAGKRIEYKVNPVKGRDLAEDWGIDPLSEETIAELAKAKKTERLKPPLDEKAMREVIELLP